MKKNTIYINGKFTAQRATGVQRMALCNVEALDAAIVAAGGTHESWVLLCPPGADAPRLAAIEVRICGPQRGGLHFWEQFYLPLASRAGSLISFSGSAPLLHRDQVFTIHDAAVFDWPQAYTRGFQMWYRFLFRTLARSARKIITVSAYSRDRIAAGLNIDPARIIVVLNGADHFDKIAEDDDILQRIDSDCSGYFLSVASQNPTKNLSTLIKAFASLPQPDVRLVLVGGSNTAVFTTTGVTTQEDPRIIRTGAISDSQLKSLYRHAQALVFPSLYEGFGLPPVEAMVCDCAVLASSAASIPEICGDAAYYFEPTSSSFIAAVMNDFLEGRLPRAQIIERGRIRVAQLSWKFSGQRLLHEFSVLGLTKLNQL
jgi:glycosyltransferase involved in cell wall biosynthesis